MARLVDRNPFRPGFGRFPPELAGRHEMVEAFAEELRTQRTGNYLIRGHRGMGKTVLVSALEVLTEWIVRSLPVGGACSVRSTTIQRESSFMGVSLLACSDSGTGRL